MGLGIVVLVVLALGYIVLAVFAAKTWPVVHVILLCLVFYAAVAFSIFAAGNLNVQIKLRGEYERRSAELEKELDKQEKLLEGDPLAGEDGDPSLRTLRGNVRRGVVDRGRVWRNLELADAQPDQISLNSSNWGDDACQSVGVGDEEFIDPIAEDDPNAVTSTTKPLQIPPGAILFAFWETPIKDLATAAKQLHFGENQLAELDTAGFCKLPTKYIGGFRVTDVAADNTSITLSPTSVPLTNEQLTELREQSFTWVLYENMPIDSHATLSGLSEAELRILFPETEMGLNAEAYAALLDEYARDRLPGQGKETDPPERTWVKVQFLKSYEVIVDVPDAAPQPNQPFDTTGRSQSAQLNQNEPTKFAEGDEVILDRETATQLRNDGFVQFASSDLILNRRLRDYEQSFRFVRTKMDDIDAASKTAQANLDSLNKSITRLLAQREFREDENQKLKHDQQGFQYELQVVTQYREALEEKLEQMRSDLSKLYKANKQLSERLMPVSANK